MEKVNFDYKIKQELLNEFEEVAEAISTEEEPFDVEYWLEAKVSEFVKQQKQSFSWKNYGK